VRLNELAAANVNGLRDEDNEVVDWVELFNTSSNVVSLAGWSLTDDEKRFGEVGVDRLTILAGHENDQVAARADRHRGNTHFAESFSSSVSDQPARLTTLLLVLKQFHPVPPLRCPHRAGR